MVSVPLAFTTLLLFPFDLDFGTLDFGTSDSGLTINPHLGHETVFQKY